MIQMKIQERVGLIPVHMTRFKLIFSSSATGGARSQDYLVPSIYSRAQMRMARSKCEAIGRPLELESKDPWSTVSAQILVQIDDALSITNFDIDDYEISYIVPRHVSQPLPLTSATSYAHLIPNAT